MKALGCECTDCPNCNGRVARQKKRIDDLDKKLDQAIDLLDANGRAFLLTEWEDANSPQRP